MNGGDPSGVAEAVCPGRYHCLGSAGEGSLPRVAGRFSDEDGAERTERSAPDVRSVGNVADGDLDPTGFEGLAVVRVGDEGAQLADATGKFVDGRGPDGGICANNDDGHPGSVPGRASGFLALPSHSIHSNRPE